MGLMSSRTFAGSTPAIAIVLPQSMMVGGSLDDPSHSPHPIKTMDKKIIVQYNNLKSEEKQVRAKLTQLECEVDKLEDELAKIDAKSDVVSVGDGRRTVISGYDRDYSKIKTEIQTKQLLIEQRMGILNMLEFEIVAQATAVEEFIHDVKDSYMRQLISYRVLDDLSWGQVAAKMGGNNTEDSVRMAFNRYFT